MARYLVKSIHTREECLQALGEILEQGPDVLAKYEWGFEDGQHTGWAIVEAESESQALDIVPAFLRSRARIVEVEKYAPERVKGFLGGLGTGLPVAHWPA